jgi:hypothetical protein
VRKIDHLIPERSDICAGGFSRRARGPRSFASNAFEFLFRFKFPLKDWTIISTNSFVWKSLLSFGCQSAASGPLDRPCATGAARHDPPKGCVHKGYQGVQHAVCLSHACNYLVLSCHILLVMHSAASHLVCSFLVSCVFI